MVRNLNIYNSTYAHDECNMKLTQTKAKLWPQGRTNVVQVGSPSKAQSGVRCTYNRRKQ
uniref:Uncharacterized protein n=1 Tax=Arundo donax TaxID=35708 RepID=A0A0A9DAA8_ARUDO